MNLLIQANCEQYICKKHKEYVYCYEGVRMIFYRELHRKKQVFSQFDLPLKCWRPLEEVMKDDGYKKEGDEE